VAGPYDPHAVESRLYERWRSAGYFHEEPDPARPPFVVCMPPPNVTARAHLGHGSTYTPMDVLTRYHRMRGENAEWLPGTDHAAIATEAVLVRQLKDKGTSRDALGREKYTELAWQWSRETGGAINEQFARLGFGPDWERARFTMDPGMSAAVTKVFVELYRAGLIYRGKRLINWDPGSQSTVSDAEIEHVERETFLWRVRYPFAASGSARAGDQQGIDVATTRPETILADVAIAVHPNDERYGNLVGKTVLVPPLLKREIPIIADRNVEPEFGTGAVKVTPAHDVNDYEIGIRHELAMPAVIDAAACITGSELDVGRFAGMRIVEARAAIVADIERAGLLVAKAPYRHSVGISERSGAVIEPMLSLQWFVNMKPLAQGALAAYHDGRLRFVPQRYGRTYEQWLENIRDWNISRQIWWGHQLPVWYAPDDSVVVAHTEEEARGIARGTLGTEQLRRDPDTLDTWFSSALWPFSILGWPQKTPELEHWYPSQVLITGWEIIFLWVARMVMLGLRFMGQIPFRDVFIAPLVFDAQGRKMSKSLGNAIDPLEMVERYGADAFRMGMMRQMRLEGQEVRFHEKRCEEARNFNNKIWNATRYMLGLSEGLPHAMSLPAASKLSIADKWILTRLHDTVAAVSRAFDEYDFGAAAETIYAFVWYEFCDWYLEASKTENDSRAGVLSFVWNNAMRLLHPIEPFISEEVWMMLPHDGPSIMTANWPDLAEIPVDRQAAADFEALRSAVERIRNLKADMKMGPRAPIDILTPQNLPDFPAQILAGYVAGTVERVQATGASFSDAAAAVTARAPRELVILRRRRELERLVTDIERARRKLSDAGFVEKAPQGVVSKEREKLAGFERELERIKASMEELEEPV